MKTPMQEVIEQLREQAQLIAPDDCVQDKFYKKGLLNAIKYAETMLEKSQKLQQEMLDTITYKEARVKELEEAAQPILDNWESGDGTTRVSELMQTLKQVLEKGCRDSAVLSCRKFNTNI